MPEWALLGEYDNGSAKGTGRTEYIWLPTADGAIPIGLYQGGKLYAIHSDHLGTPRLMTSQTNTPVWQWPYSGFGNNKPTGVLKSTASPTQSGGSQAVMLKATAPTEMNLRMPGQYFDSETGAFYNDFRQYDARTGRYTQSDLQLDSGHRHKTVSLDICFFESEIAKNRVSAKLVFRNTSSISQVADLQNMEKNAFAGNINHWIIGDRASPTFIYLNDGCLSIKADKPEIQSLL